MDFVVGKETVSIVPSAGVRQGDALSTRIFNLAAEPLLRAAQSESNPGINLFGQIVKATAYADDIAVVSNTAQALQESLNHLSRLAKILGLKFNAEKCASLNFINGKPFQVDLFVDGRPIKSLGPDDQEIYLGTPIGAKLRFRPPNQLVFGSHLLPSLSHHLASGRVLKDVLSTLDTEYRKFLGHITMVPNAATTPFFYVDRRVGGLGTFSLTDDADIWTLARAVQLLTSKDRTQSCEGSGMKPQQLYRLGNTFPGGTTTPHSKISKCSPSRKSCFSLGNRPINNRHPRLDLLPLRGYSWSSSDNKTCRHCGESSENGFHQLLSRKGYTAIINRELPESRLKPDVELEVS
ncbi:hypothetical protein GHT06_018577 [Daphnia sinensis]|uniref:Reverse transcriptase domain-containing protein n=1 Tax=Daphnia sinensis TaxID=1820382 RepID=A0AAD5KND6_9CRUS|nr:hypothetical protein GHT06_018577 [Daphnia sinensis]